MLLRPSDDVYIDGCNDDYHKRWHEDAEIELRRIVRERDEEIKSLKAEVKRLKSNTRKEPKPKSLAVVRGMRATG